jgi:hypothetical protein
MEGVKEKTGFEMERAIKLLSNRTKNINFRVNPELKELFEEVCKREGITVSDCLNYLMLMYTQEKGMIEEEE